jgi:hypothetical protein
MLLGDDRFQDLIYQVSQIDSNAVRIDADFTMGPKDPDVQIPSTDYF